MTSYTSATIRGGVKLAIKWEKEHHFGQHPRLYIKEEVNFESTEQAEKIKCKNLVTDLLFFHIL